MKEMRLMRAIGEIDDKYIEEAAPFGEKKTAIRFVPWTKFAGIAACAAIAIGAGIFALTQQGGNIVASPGQTEEETSDYVQYVSPIAEFDTLSEAENAVGFDIEIPESYGDYSTRRFLVITGTILEIQYYDDSENRGMNIRKTRGGEDVSGDYNVYDNVYGIQTAAGAVTIKGNDGEYDLAVWNSGEFSYSVSVDSGISEDEMIKIVEKIQ